MSVSSPCVPVAPSTNVGYTVSSAELFADAVILVASVAVATAMFAVPSNDVPPIVLAVAKAVAVAANPTAIFAEPSNDVPPMVLAVAKAVAVSALPVTFPVNGPANASEVTVPSKNAPHDCRRAFSPTVPAVPSSGCTGPKHHRAGCPVSRDPLAASS